MYGILDMTKSSAVIFQANFAKEKQFNYFQETGLFAAQV